MRKISKKIILAILLLTVLVGAFIFAIDFYIKGNAVDNKEECDYYIYCVNKDGIGLDKWEFDLTIEETEKDFAIRELIKAFMKEPSKEGCKSAKTDKISGIYGKLTGDIVVVNTDKNYYQLTNLEQTLYRAAIVYTLTQVEGVNYVYFNVENKAVLDSDGEKLGGLNRDSFSFEGEENAVATKEISMSLYYANSTGNKLMEYKGTYEYREGTSRERFVLEKLMTLPDRSDMYPVLNQGLVIKDIYTSNGVCYVNMDGNINSGTVTIQNPEIFLYAMVNSLTDLAGVYRVQFMIDGRSDVKFRGKISLYDTFTYNVDLLEGGAL